MTEKEIEHLARLARLRLSREEVTRFQKEIESILECVSAVKRLTPSVPESVASPVQNVFRADEVTTPPGTYTEKMLDACPHRAGRFLSVKKILSADR
jgi:aspartyl-tRNA(Asn)/glutamyl-tRNA(Gln) amidotransferase subunit C